MTSGFLPKPFPDELLYGLLGRQRRLIGCPAAAGHTASLFGARTAIAAPLLQGRLGTLASRLGIPGLDAFNLLTEHTLFPYYTAFQPIDVVETMKRDLIGSARTSAFVKLGLAAFGIASTGAELRICPSCHLGQVRDAGAASWLRKHQLPGSLVCDVHGDVLVPGYVVQNDHRGRHEFVWLSDIAPIKRSSVWSAEQSSILLNIARRQSEIVLGNRKPRRLSEWKLHYRGLLASRNLMRSAKKVDHARLRSVIIEALGPALPLLPAPCRKLDEGGWPGLLVREHRKAMHPLYHVLMETVLASVLPAQEPLVLSASAPRRRVGARVASSARICTPRRDWEAEDRSAAVRLVKAHDLILRQEPPRRVTFSALERQGLAPGWLQKRKCLLPLAFQTAQDLCESDESFMMRRLTYWSKNLGGEPLWRLCRAAGIRHQRWPEAKSIIFRSEPTGSVCSERKLSISKQRRAKL